jgi:hypothetical protein
MSDDEFRAFARTFVPEAIETLKRIAVSPCTCGHNKKKPCVSCQALRELVRRRLLR